MQSLTSPLHSMRLRLPARNEILQVFGVVIFAVFGWSIRGFLYKIPAFTLYFGLGSNLAILCYMFAFALLESLLVTGALLLAAVVLPARALTKGFAYKGFVVILVTSIAMILFEGYFRVDFFKQIMAGDDSSIPPFAIGLTASVLAVIALFWLVRIQPFLQKAVLYVMEQLSVFTYIYVPLGLIGAVVVLIRNLR